MAPFQHMSKNHNPPPGPIPDTVKIQGRTVRVNVSGRGYVRVGESVADARDLYDRPEEWEALKSHSTTEAWQEVMKTAFCHALAAERQRLKQ